MPHVDQDPTMGGMGGRLHIALGTGAAAAAVAFGAASATVNAERYAPELVRSATDDLVEAVLVLAAAVLVAAGGWWWWNRPTNSTAAYLLLSGASLGVMQGLFWAGGWDDVGPVLSMVFLAAGFGTSFFVYAAVLSWPNGRLRRSDRSLLWWYTGLGLGLSLIFAFAGADPDARPVLMVSKSVVVARAALELNRLVVSPFMALVVLVVVQRRLARVPVPSRSLFSAALVSAWAMFVVDGIVLPVVTLGDLWSVGGDPAPFALAANVMTWGRYALVGAACWRGAHRYLRLGRGAGAAQVELGSVRSQHSLVDALRARTGDPLARVAFAGRAGWVDADGSPATMGGTPGRTVTTLVRDGAVVAAVELDRRFDDQPVLVESVAASVSVQLENERLQALAFERLDEVRRARLSIVDAEDAARRRLERDLHDGAQQRIVALALQARLAAAQGTPTAAEVAAIADGLAEAREELVRVAEGVMPTVLAEQGLGAALATLAVTTPLAVQIDVDLPEGLPPRLAAVGWFVVTEAVANAIKHAQASRIWVGAVVVAGSLRVEVRDDGIGGADVDRGSGLRGLQSRLVDAGGGLEVRSEVGSGTVVLATVPLPSPWGATPADQPLLVGGGLR
jgi:signal transduction histidine kinase